MSNYPEQKPSELGEKAHDENQKSDSLTERDRLELLARAHKIRKTFDRLEAEGKVVPFTDFEESRENIQRIQASIEDFYAEWGLDIPVVIDLSRVYVVKRGHESGKGIAGHSVPTGVITLNEKWFDGKEEQPEGTTTVSKQHVPHLLRHELIHKSGSTKMDAHASSGGLGPYFSYESGFSRRADYLPVNVGLNFNEGVTELLARIISQRVGDELYRSYEVQVRVLQEIIRKIDGAYPQDLDPKTGGPFFKALMEDYTSGTINSLALLEDHYGKGSFMIFEQITGGVSIDLDMRIYHFFKTDDPVEREALRNEIIQTT